MKTFRWKRQSKPRTTRRLFLEALEERSVPTITATPQTLSMTEGASANVLIATFTDTDPSPLNTYFVAVSWGDGALSSTTTTTTVTQDSITGVFSVNDTHVYAEETPAATPN